MIAFWAVAGVLAAAAAGLVLFRAAHAAMDEAGDPTPAVYRRQLAEIDDLAEQGLMGEAERRSAHAEAARRLLAAADAPHEAWAARPNARRVVVISVGLAAAAALVVYFAVGHVGMADQPFAARLASWRAADPASLDPPELAAVLTRMTRERPNDAEAFHFLAIAQGAAQNPAEAVRAMRRAVQLAPQRADLWELFGEALVAAAGGEITPEAQEAFRQTLARDPKSIAARFHLARAQLQAGDKAAGIAGWRGLLADLPAVDPRRPALIQAIAEAERAPAAAPGLPEGQLAAIQGMVEGLAQRLKTTPDDPQGWVRLVRAYAVLGDTAKRDAALAQARARYAANPDMRSQLDAAARAEPMR
ncbi:c-type cytochrome biogenesis protein CcmI [Phenylobacterium sp. LjRoot225]|uniref:c-type cytochrome biogenesis protein CcmI n=1 Tax=Phenylobacterium sp. LjRoot225 TaxID=3342285 RepID=UPI003ECE6605